MKLGRQSISSGKSFKLPITLSGLKLSLILIIVFTIVSSPIVMLTSPALIAAPSSSTEGSTLAPSTIGQDGSDFTIQAALSSLTARPTNNIVNTNSFYDVVFLTATAGAIKTIQVTFPAGTTIPSGAFFNEAEGIGPGTASKSGQTITYTVTNAVNVPAGIKIRLEFANINNPLSPSANYKVTVTTRNAANAIIDGPTQSMAYTMKQIGTNAIADNSITGSKMADINKLIFGTCTGNLPFLAPQEFADIECLDPNAQSGDQIVAERSNPRNPPSAVKMNSVALDGLVAFGFENPSNTTTASQEGVEISYIIFKKL